MGVIVAVAAGWAVFMAGRALAVRQDAGLRAGLAAVAAHSQVLDRRAARGWLARIGSSRLARRLGREARLRTQWDLAGQPGSLDGIFGLRLVVASLGCAIGLLASITSPTALMLVPILVLIGIRAPEIVLGRLGRRRRESIATHVPDLVELLLSTTEAGLNPLIAFQRSADVLTGPLGVELRHAARLIDLGLPWRKALDDLAMRSQVPSLRRLVVGLARSNRLGTAVGSTLRGVAAGLRAERRARAEELARRAPVKMLFPLVFLILPAFLLLTVGPVVLATIRSLR